MAQSKKPNRKEEGNHSTLGEKLTVIGLGFPTLALAIGICFYWLPSILHADEFDVGLVSRLVFGMKCCGVSSLCLVVGIQVVANQRLSSRQINPLGNAEPSYRFQVNSRYVSNTTEQLLLMCIGTMAACAYESISLNLVFIMNMMFIIGRVMFWIGYHIEPTKRAAGMSLTFFASHVLIIYTSYLFFSTEFMKVLP